MSNTALGAEGTKKENIIFISDTHEKFYYEKLKEVRYQDVYHKALVYCLGICDDRMAFNLYCNGMPSVSDYENAEEQVVECRQYTVEELFCCAYAPYFWQAIQIRYPEYATYNRKLYALFGGAD